MELGRGGAQGGQGGGGRRRGVRRLALAVDCGRCMGQRDVLRTLCKRLDPCRTSPVCGQQSSCIADRASREGPPSCEAGARAGSGQQSSVMCRWSCFTGAARQSRQWRRGPWACRLSCRAPQSSSPRPCPRALRARHAEEEAPDEVRGASLCPPASLTVACKAEIEGRCVEAGRSCVGRRAHPCQTPRGGRPASSSPPW